MNAEDQWRNDQMTKLDFVLDADRISFGGATGKRETV